MTHSPDQLAPLAYSVDEAMRITSLGRTAIYQLIGEGRLKTRLLGRRRLVMADSLRALISGEAA